MTPASAEPDQPFEPRQDTGPPVPAARADTWIGGLAAIIAAACYSSFLLSPWTQRGPIGRAVGGFIQRARSAWPAFRVAVPNVRCPGRPLCRHRRVAMPCIACRRWSVTAVVLFALAGASSILDAATSMQCDPNTSVRCAQGEHTASGLVKMSWLACTPTPVCWGLSAARLAPASWVPWSQAAGPGWGRLQVALGIGIASCGLADIILLLAEWIRTGLNVSGCFSPPVGSWP